MTETAGNAGSYLLTVPLKTPTQRIDAWLAAECADLSRSRIQDLLEQGNVTSSDGRKLSKRSKLEPGMRIRVQPPPARPTELLPQDIPLEILYEDDSLIAVNKQPGLVVHPAPGHPDGTLVNAMLHHCPGMAGIGGEKRPGIVHRLDADTSGVIVVAKSDAAMERLAAQFAQRNTEKHYLAICHGVPHPGRGTIRTTIGRSSHDRKRMMVNPPRGRDAVSHYLLRQCLHGGLALLDVRIETGRTHQIRVHLAHIRHPIAGDPLYGSRKRDAALQPAPPKRQLLHAYSLAIDHPATGKRLEFTAPVPADMRAFIVPIGPA